MLFALVEVLVEIRFKRFAKTRCAEMLYAQTVV